MMLISVWVVLKLSLSFSKLPALCECCNAPLLVYVSITVKV